MSDWTISFNHGSNSLGGKIRNYSDPEHKIPNFEVPAPLNWFTSEEAASPPHALPTIMIIYFAAFISICGFVLTSIALFIKVETDLVGLDKFFLEKNENIDREHRRLSRREKLFRLQKNILINDHQEPIALHAPNSPKKASKRTTGEIRSRSSHNTHLDYDLAIDDIV